MQTLDCIKCLLCKNIPWEVYWGFMYRIAFETGSALRSTLPPRWYLDRDVKVEQSSFKFVTEEERRDKTNKRKAFEDLGALVLDRLRRPRRFSAESGCCLVQRPAVDHWFFNSRPYQPEGWIQWGPIGVGAFRILSNNLSLPERSFATEPVYSVWLWALRSGQACGLQSCRVPLHCRAVDNVCVGSGCWWEKIFFDPQIVNSWPLVLFSTQL